MARIVIIRHGQASYGQADYDQLSERGVRQCEALGRFWVERGWRPDEVVVGPRRRHWQSHDAVAQALRAAGIPWPTPVEDPLLDEYQAFEVMDRFAPGHKDLLIDTEEGRRQYFLLYRQTMRRWIAGHCPADEIETWQQFRRRVETSVERMRKSLANGGGGRTIFAFTSGGPTAAATGYALGLDDLHTMEQSWMIANGSYTEFLVSNTPDEDRFSLYSFNAVPHLNDPDLLTGA